MPQLTKPQLAVYAAFAIAVLLIGSRFLRSGSEGGAAPPLSGVPAGALGAADGAGSVGGGAGAAGAAGSGADGGGGETGAGGADGADGDGALGGAEGGAAGLGAGAAGAGAGAGGGAVVVDVKGAVRRPGVYRLPAGARALDAVRRAGGVTGRADRLRVNLAAPVTDGGEVVVPRRGEAAPVGAAPATGTSASGGAAAAGGAPEAPLQIDINTASAVELEALDGVGPATAAKIVAYRDANGPFASIEELDPVSGIGEAKLAAIMAQLGR